MCGAVVKITTKLYDYMCKLNLVELMRENQTKITELDLIFIEALSWIVPGDGGVYLLGSYML